MQLSVVYQSNLHICRTCIMSLCQALGVDPATLYRYLNGCFMIVKGAVFVIRARHSNDATKAVPAPPPKIRGLGVNNPLSNHLFSRGPCRRSCHAPAVAFLLACKLSSTKPVSDFSTPPASFDSGLVFIHGQNNVACVKRVKFAFYTHIEEIIQRHSGVRESRVDQNTHARIRILTYISKFILKQDNQTSIYSLEDRYSYILYLC